MKTKVTLLGSSSGPIAGRQRQAGEVIDLPDEEAHSLHDAGLVAIQKLTRLEIQKLCEAAGPLLTGKEQSGLVSLPATDLTRSFGGGTHAAVVAALEVLKASPAPGDVQTSAQADKPAAGKKK